MSEVLYFNIVKASSSSEFGFHIYISNNEDTLATNDNWKEAISFLGKEEAPGVWGRFCVNIQKSINDLKSRGYVQSNKLRFQGEKSLLN